MSKSLGNFLTIREVLADHHPEVLRFFVFSTHYRNPLDYSDSALKDSAVGLERLYSAVAGLEQLPAACCPGCPGHRGRRSREAGRVGGTLHGGHG